MHVIPAFSFFAGDEACTRRSSSSRPRIAAPADRSTASAVLAAGGGTARLLAEAGSCLASSFAGAEAEAIGSELLRRPRGRATQVRQSTDVCLSLFRAHATKYCKIIPGTKHRIKQNTMVRHSRKSTRDQGPTNRSTYIPTMRCLDRELLWLTREIRHGASRPDPHGTRVSRVNRNAAGRVERFSKSRGSGRVRSRHLKIFASRVGSGDPTRPDP